MDDGLVFRVDSVESTDNERVKCESGESSGRKRVRNESCDSDRVDSDKSNEIKRVKGESDESDQDSVEVKRLRNDLFGMLDDLDPDSASQELYSVMKSFEDELSGSPAPSSGKTTQPELGYLLEASDDELGLPPAEGKGDDDAVVLVGAASDSSGIDELSGLDIQIPSYDSFDLAVGDGYIPVDGLFEYPDVCFDSGDLSTLWPVSSPAE